MPRTNGTSRRSWGESTYPGLIAGAAANSDTAWRTLVADYEPLLRYWCRRASLNDAAIDDVVQAVLLQLSQSLKNFKDDGRKASFRRWLRAITRSRIADYLRQEQRTPQSLGGTTGTDKLLRISRGSLSDGPDVSSRVAHVERLLASARVDFADDTWQAFWLTTVEDLTSAEAAAALNLSANAVRLAKARVLKRLRELDTPSQERA